MKLLKSIPYEEYASSKGLRHSLIKDAVCSTVAHAMYNKDNPKQTRALDQGIIIHTCVYEFERFRKEYSLPPSSQFAEEYLPLLSEKERERVEEKPTLLDSANSKAYKEVVSALETAGYNICTRSDYQMAMAIRNKILADEDARKMIVGGDAEVSVWWKDPVHKVTLKGRVDYLQQGKSWAVPSDLKSCQSANPYVFGSQSYSLGYDMKASMYIDGVEAVTKKKVPYFFFLAVEKKEPYELGLFYVENGSDEYLIGRDRYREGIAKVKEAMKSKTYIGYTSPEGKRLIKLEYPKYAMFNHLEENEESF